MVRHDVTKYAKLIAHCQRTACTICSSLQPTNCFFNPGTIYIVKKWPEGKQLLSGSFGGAVDFASRWNYCLINGLRCLWSAVLFCEQPRHKEEDLEWGHRSFNHFISMSFWHRLLDTVPVVIVLSLRIFVFVSTWWWRQFYGRWPAGVASSNSTNRTSDLLMQRFPANPISEFGKTRYPTVNSYPLFHIRVAHHQSFFSPNRLNNSFSPRHGNKENDHNSKSKVD